MATDWGSFVALILNTLWKRTLSCFVGQRNKGWDLWPGKINLFPSCGSFSPMSPLPPGVEHWGIGFILFSFLLMEPFSQDSGLRARTLQNTPGCGCISILCPQEKKKKKAEEHHFECCFRPCFLGCPLSWWVKYHCPLFYYLWRTEKKDDTGVEGEGEMMGHLVMQVCFSTLRGSELWR